MTHEKLQRRMWLMQKFANSEGCMFRDAIKNASEMFIKEAHESPMLLADMAALELYMGESYSERTFIELLQNADDALSSKVLITIHDQDVFFANNGRAFDEQDLYSICRSGASNKERGKAIGYRGVGFKSAAALTSDIIIYSDKTYFTFSKAVCANILNRPQSMIPTIRIPLLLDSVPDSIKERIQEYEERGYTTVFIFRHAQTSSIINEIDTLTSGMFLFLNNIKECEISSRGCTQSFKVFRTLVENARQISIESNFTTDNWVVFSNAATSIAFLVEDDIIVPCSDSESVFHCYLPALDKTGYQCKINGDFSTDPSRKHLIYDEHTQVSLLRVSELIFEILKAAIHSKNCKLYKNLFNIFFCSSIFTKAGIELNNLMRDMLSTQGWLLLNSGNQVSASEYRVFPSEYESIDIQIIRKLSSYAHNYSLSDYVYDAIDRADAFLQQFSTIKFSTSELVIISSEPEFISRVNIETMSKLVADIITRARNEYIVLQKSTDFRSILFPTETHEYKSLTTIAIQKLEVLKDFQALLANQLSNAEVIWFLNETGIELAPQLSQISQLPSEINRSEETSIASKHYEHHNNIVNLKPHVTRWRGAETKCVEIERFWGNSAKDVSIRNEGYDVFSTTSAGVPRYIEVKSVKRDWEFSLTNNEYTAAAQFENNYFVCLICEDDTKLRVKYICNPLSNATFEKRIRQWEWVCLKYNSEEYSFDFNN